MSIRLRPAKWEERQKRLDKLIEDHGLTNVSKWTGWTPRTVLAYTAYKSGQWPDESGVIDIIRIERAEQLAPTE